MDILDKVQELLKIQGNNGNWNYSSYMCGMYNGMEVIISTLEKREPIFRSKPEGGWLNDIIPVIEESPVVRTD